MMNPPLALCADKAPAVNPTQAVVHESRIAGQGSMWLLPIRVHMRPRLGKNWILKQTGLYSSHLKLTMHITGLFCTPLGRLHPQLNMHTNQ